MGGERLRVVEGGAVGSDVPLDEDEFRIGRAQEGIGRLADDPEISRSHARVRRAEDGALEVEDLGSTNGTFVNGTRIEGLRRLQPGDRIRVGQTTLEVLPEVGEGYQPTRMTALPAREEPAARKEPAAREEPAARATRRPDDAAGAAGPARRQPLSALAPRDARPSDHRRLRGRGPQGGRSRSRTPALLALGALAVALVAVVAVFALNRDEEEPAPRPTPAPPLDARQILERNAASTVIINTRGPGRDESGNEDVVDGGGSGTVVDAKRGLVVTNAHVVAGQTSIRVGVGEDAEGSSARVVGQAPCEDLAVLELRPVPRGLKAATLGDASRVGAGDKVVALGYPGAFEENPDERKLKTNEGNVTSEPDAVTLGRDLPRLPVVIEHQAPINPGNSGGPLFDDRGRVIGINTVRTGNEDQSGAISVERLKQLLPELRSGRNQGYVGWNVRVLRLQGDDSLPLVLGVDPNSPGDRAGLRFGDVVRRVDDTLVRDVPDVCEILGSKAPGDRVKVSGLRLSQGRLFQARVALR